MGWFQKTFLLSHEIWLFPASASFHHKTWIFPEKCAWVPPNQFNLEAQGSWALMVWTNIENTNVEPVYGPTALTSCKWRAPNELCWATCWCWTVGESVGLLQGACWQRQRGTGFPWRWRNQQSLAKSKWEVSRCPLAGWQLLGYMLTDSARRVIMGVPLQNRLWSHGSWRGLLKPWGVSAAKTCIRWQKRALWKNLAKVPRGLKSWFSQNCFPWNSPSLAFASSSHCDNCAGVAGIRRVFHSIATKERSCVWQVEAGLDLEQAWGQGSALLSSTSFHAQHQMQSIFCDSFQVWQDFGRAFYRGRAIREDVLDRVPSSLRQESSFDGRWLPNCPHIRNVTIFAEMVPCHPRSHDMHVSGIPRMTNHFACVLISGSMPDMLHSYTWCTHRESPNSKVHAPWKLSICGVFPRVVYFDLCFDQYQGVVGSGGLNPLACQCVLWITCSCYARALDLLLRGFPLLA